MSAIAYEDFIPHPFGDLAARKALLPEMTRDVYDRRVAAFRGITDMQCRRIRYKSGGFTVTGLFVAPRHIEAGKHPLIIFNRGGNRDFGMLTALTAMRTLVPLARRTQALVFASNYRGVDGGEGVDEFGGADVEDVLALLAFAREHPGWDGGQSLMVGGSRGGMMTLLALKAGAAVNAAALIAGMSDMAASIRERPAMEKGVYAPMIPGFADHREERIRERSAICWPEAIHVPLLLLHGDADVRVNVMQSIRLAEALAKLNRPHELAVYPGDDHSLTRNWEDALKRIGNWLR